MTPARSSPAPNSFSTPWRSGAKTCSLACLAGLLALVPFSCAARPPSPENSPQRALILCIGDGFGWGALSVAEQLVEGSTLLSEADAVGALRTHAYTEPVTDSAAAATALATGRRTHNGWLATDPETRAPMETIAEAALGRGLAVGLVTTSGITHATPAAFAAHVPDREEHERIAEQMAGLGLDLMAGGDRGYFLPRASGGLRSDGRDLAGALQSAGTVVTETLTAARAAAPDRPLALLFALKDPPPAGPARPALADLMDLALRRLSRDPEGFFLMVEGAQIDWSEHDRDASVLPLELADFDRAVARARSFARQRANTVVVVVADHDTGGPAPVLSEPPDEHLEIWFLSGEHTALLIPILVTGEAARPWVRLRHLADLGTAMRGWLLGEAR